MQLVIEVKKLFFFILSLRLIKLFFKLVTNHKQKTSNEFTYTLTTYLTSTNHAYQKFQMLDASPTKINLSC